MVIKARTLINHTQNIIQIYNKCFQELAGSQAQEQIFFPFFLFLFPFFPMFLKTFFLLFLFLSCSLLEFLSSSRMKNKSEIGEVDKISQLPDDVLVHIFSRLTWREVIATSILSTRWRRLNTYITRLTFSTRHPSKHKYIGFSKHTKEIYDFLSSSKSCRFLKEFEVDVPCLKGANIKTWLPLVLEREVESIHIGMIYRNKAMPGYCNLDLWVYAEISFS